MERHETKAVFRALLSPEHTLQRITVSRPYSPKSALQSRLLSRALLAPEHTLWNPMSHTNSFTLKGDESHVKNQIRMYAPTVCSHHLMSAHQPFSYHEFPS